MRHKIFISIGCIMGFFLKAQDLPPITQKLSDGVWQFPSLTGYSGGAAYVAYKRSASNNIQFAPTVSMAGVHGSFAKSKIGIGTNMYYESVNVLQNMVLSAQLANHLRLNKKYDLSFGLSTELFRSDINRQRLEAVDASDTYLTNFKPITLVDFSPGMSLSHKRFQLGFTVNRIRKLIHPTPSYLLNGFYTVFCHTFFDFSGGKHKLEPSLILRYDPNIKYYKNEAWLFYTYSEKYTLGLTYMFTGRAGASVAFKLDNRWQLGYSFDTQVSDQPTGVYGKYSHEIVLRFNLNKQYYRRPHFDPNQQPRQNISKEKED